MSNFSDFLLDQGLEGVDQLESFLNEFMIDPTILFSLTEKERTDLESQMDDALALLETIKEKRSLM